MKKKIRPKSLKDPQSYPKTVSEWLVEDSLLLFSNSFKCINTLAKNVYTEFVEHPQKGTLGSDSIDKSHSPEKTEKPPFNSEK